MKNGRGLPPHLGCLTEALRLGEEVFEVALFSLALPFLWSERLSLIVPISSVRAPPASFVRPWALSIAPSFLSSLLGTFTSSFGSWWGNLQVIFEDPGAKRAGLWHNLSGQGPAKVREFVHNELRCSDFDSCVLPSRVHETTSGGALQMKPKLYNTQG